MHRRAWSTKWVATLNNWGHGQKALVPENNRPAYCCHYFYVNIAQRNDWRIMSVLHHRLPPCIIMDKIWARCWQRMQHNDMWPTMSGTSQKMNRYVTFHWKNRQESTKKINAVFMLTRQTINWPETYCSIRTMPESNSNPEPKLSSCCCTEAFNAKHFSKRLNETNVTRNLTRTHARIWYP